MGSSLKVKIVSFIRRFYKRFYEDEFFYKEHLPPSKNLMIENPGTGKWEEVEGAYILHPIKNKMRDVIITVAFLLLLAFINLMTVGTIVGNITYWLFILINIFSLAVTLHAKRYKHAVFYSFLTIMLISVWVFKH